MLSTAMGRIPLLLLATGLAIGNARPVLIDLQGSSIAGGKPMAEAVIWLDAPGARRPGAKAMLDQRNLSFNPRVMAVQVGTPVTFPNSDRVFHNVFSTHESNKFDLGLYPVGAVKTVPFDRPGLSRIFCSIHPQMAAYVMVVDTPYFAVSDAQGRFVIEDVPPGTYTYHAWRPGGGIRSDSIVVNASARMLVEWP
jgi:plastocyanin